MLFIHRKPGSNASDDSDDYQPLARGLLWDGNRLRGDPDNPPRSPNKYDDPQSSYDENDYLEDSEEDGDEDSDDEGEKDEDEESDEEGSEDSDQDVDEDSDKDSDKDGNDDTDEVDDEIDDEVDDDTDDKADEMSIGWSDTSSTGIPPLHEEPWFQLTETYGVEFAIERLIDPENSLEDRAEFVTEFNGLLAIIGVWAERGLRVVWEHIVREGLPKPLLENPRLMLIRDVQRPQFRVTGEQMLLSLLDTDLVQMVRSHLCKPYSLEARGEVAFELVTMWEHFGMLVDEATTYIWEKIIEPEELWDDDVGGEAAFRNKLVYEDTPDSPIGRWRDLRSEMEENRRQVSEKWGEGWEYRLDPTERWIPRANPALWTLLRSMVTAGYPMAEIRGYLDLDT